MCSESLRLNDDGPHHAEIPAGDALHVGGCDLLHVGRVDVEVLMADSGQLCGMRMSCSLSAAWQSRRPAATGLGGRKIPGSCRISNRPWRTCELDFSPTLVNLATHLDRGCGKGRVTATSGALRAALPRARPNRGYCEDGTAAGTHTHCQACVTPSPYSTYFPCGYTTSRWTIVCR